MALLLGDTVQNFIQASTDGYKVATPTNWRDGDDVIVLPAVSDEDAVAMFPKGMNAVKPYLRVTPQPNK
jgi:hypothetical protein